MEYRDEHRERRVTQLRKGILELAILGALRRERHYGYSLVRTLTASSDLDLKEGTIYPILSRLDRDGLLRSEWVESEQGPPRKYYSLTPLGGQLLEGLMEEFEKLVDLVRTSGRGDPASAPAAAPRRIRI